MDENDLQTDESEEESLRAMEKDIDEFLSSIRENVSKSTNLQNEGTSSEVHEDYDPISSDDCFEKDPLPSRSDEPGIQGHARKLHSRPLKKKQKMGKRNLKTYEKHKLQNRYSHEEWQSCSGRRFGQSSGDEDYHQKSSPPRWGDEYDCDISAPSRSEEFHQERSLSPKSDNDHKRSFSPSGRNEHQDARSIFPNRKDNYHQWRRFTPRGGYKYKRRNSYPEEMDEPSQNSYAFNERKFDPKRTIISRSRSSDDEDEGHRVHSRGSNSPIDWSESYDYDSDFEDQDSNEPWRLEEKHPYVEENRDGQNATSFIVACLQRAIAYNPDIATKVTEACMALINIPADGPAESDYECDRDSWATHEEESGRLYPERWRGRRSPSFAESVGASSNRSGFSHHSDRFPGHSKRSVLERSLSPDDRQAGRNKYNDHGRHKKARYSPDYKRHDDARPSTAASETQRARTRSVSEYSKNHHEEEFNLKGAVSWSVRKIRKQCEGESSSTIRRAMLSLLEVHERECKRYMKKPEAHPDHKKEYREFVHQKTKSIVDLGGDPNGYDFEQDWKKYWPIQMYKLFQESWNTKMQSCTSLLQKKCGSSSKSSHSSSSKSIVKQHRKKRRRAHEKGSEGEKVNVEDGIKKTSKTKRELVEVTHSKLGDLQNIETNSAILYKKEDINKEIFTIFKLLNHIKHRFNDCEESFDKLYVQAMNLKEDSVAINNILQCNLPLLEKIDENLRETLEDANLNLIQKVVIQETLERFRSFLEKSKEISSHSMRSNEAEIRKNLMDNMDASVEGTEREHQIPCHLTDSYSSVVSSECGKEVTLPLYGSCSCCRTNQQVSQPVRTLTEISLVGSSGPQSRALYTPKNISGASFLLCKSEDGIHCSRDFTSDVTSLENQASRPRRTLTEISLVGSSCPAGSATHKHSVVLMGKDSDMTQPPPPGVTPPPPGVTPPPRLTPPHFIVTPSPPGVTPPPPGVTPPPSIVTLSPPAIAPTPDVTLSPPGVTQQLPHVTSSCGAALPSSGTKPTSGITFHSVTMPPSSITTSHSVTMPPSSITSHSVTIPPRVSTPLQSVITTSHSVTTVSHGVAPSSAVVPQCNSVSPQPPSSTSDVSLTSPRVTPLTPPGVSLSSVGNGLQSSVWKLPQTQVLGSSPPAASVPLSRLANDKTDMVSQHVSTISLEQGCKSSKKEVTRMASVTDTPPQPSKELLRSTIKDCFLSSTSSEESCDIKSTKEGLSTIDTSVEGSSVASVPNLPEDVLKMFEVKPEDSCKVSSDDKISAKMDNIKRSRMTLTTKKPIKITFPQSSKQKRMLELNPLSDDQELL